MNKPNSGTKKPQKSRFEFSAGGVVQDGPNLLMVKVQNLEGEQVWTFPKGHIEKGEKAEEASLREVEEETGYRCEVIKPFERVQYYFQRAGQLTKKTVTWFLMKPLEKTGAPDAEEILETEWVSMDEASRRAKYKSDKTLLAKLKR
jgi:ADP-ribose pyrophosphatase YjhB (NUDIX family)